MKIILYIVFFILSVNVFAQSDLFKKANNAYEDENYAEAVTYYDSILNQGYVDADLYFNLGNSYFQTGEIGKAILNFEKALKILPGHEKALNNLSIAQSQTLDKIENENATLFDWLLIQSTFLSPNGWAWLTIILAFIVLSSYLIFKFYSKKALKVVCFYSGIVFFVLFSFSFAISAITYYKIKKVDKAVVMKKQVDVKSSPAENSETVFNLHEGTTTKILTISDDWIEISVNQGNIGWIKKGELELVEI